VPFQIFGNDIAPLDDLGLDVTFDPTNLVFDTAILGSGAAGWTVTTQSLSQNEARIHLTRPQAVVPAPGDTMMLLRFTTTSYAHGDASVVVGDPTGDLAGARICAGEVEFIGEVSGIGDGLPVTGYLLGPNYPNPFRASTSLEFSVPEGSPERMEIVVFDVAGRLVKRLVEGEFPPGIHRTQWHGDTESGVEAAPGIYFALFRSAGHSQSRKMLLAR
jgi:hypothetical protein